MIIKLLPFKISNQSQQPIHTALSPCRDRCSLLRGAFENDLGSLMQEPVKSLILAGERQLLTYDSCNNTTSNTRASESGLRFLHRLKDTLLRMF